MITSVGKSILSKYLVGQTTSYASYIAIGGGATPLKATDALANYSSQTSLNMEMLRVPIISKGYVIEPFSVTSTTGTIGTVSGTGPYTATITGLSSIANFTIGQQVTATAGTGNFGSGVVTITGIPSSTSISVSSTAIFYAGTITNITPAGYCSKLVLTAELPTQERYAFTEIGIYPSQSNSLALSDSRNISGFTTDEGWVAAGTTYGVSGISLNFESSTSTSSIPEALSTGTIGAVTGTGPYIATITKLPSTTKFLVGEIISATPASTGTIGNLGSGTVTVTSIIDSTSIAISSTASMTAGDIINIIGYGPRAIFSSDAGLNATTRLQRFEGFRYLTNKILVPNNFSSITTGSGLYTLSGNYLKLSTGNIDFSKNSLNDQLILGLTVFSTDPSSSAAITGGNVVISFESSTNSSSNYTAQFQGTFTTSLNGPRYFVITKKLSELVLGSNFAWNMIDTIKVYVNNSNTVNTTYIGLDLLRFENVSDTAANPLYGLTGYTVVKSSLDSTNSYATPIIKLANNSNFIEFKFVTAVS